MGKLSAFFSKQDQKKLEKGLANTKKSFLSKLGTALVGKTKIDEDLLDELEDALIQSDVGVTTTLKIIKALEARTAKDKNRPLLQIDNPREVLTRLMDQRDPLYQEVADITIYTDDRNPKFVVQEILKRLSEINIIE